MEQSVAENQPFSMHVQPALCTMVHKTNVLESWTLRQRTFGDTSTIRKIIPRKR